MFRVFKAWLLVALSVALTGCATTDELVIPQSETSQVFIPARGGGGAPPPPPPPPATPPATRAGE